MFRSVTGLVLDPNVAELSGLAEKMGLAKTELVRTVLPIGSLLRSAGNAVKSCVAATTDRGAPLLNSRCGVRRQAPPSGLPPWASEELTLTNRGRQVPRRRR